MALQPNGKIVAVGDSSNGSNFDFAVARYNADGTLDGTFGTGGKVTTPIGSSFDSASSVAIQPNGKIVAAGYGRNGSNNDFALVRYDGDARVSPPPPTYYDLTVEKAGTGSGAVVSDPHMGIDCGADCTESLAEGTYGILKATPEDGSTFTGWSGGPCLPRGGWFDKPDECAVRMDGDRTVTATFAQEVPPTECADDQDNDSDGFTDYPDDPDCTGPDDDDESSPPPVLEEHSRTVSLSTRHVGKKLAFDGTLSSSHAPCAASQQVILQQRKNGEWNDRKTTTTGDTGLFVMKVKDRKGKYRFVARKTTIEAGPPQIDCLYASSGRMRHRH